MAQDVIIRTDCRAWVRERWRCQLPDDLDLTDLQAVQAWFFEHEEFAGDVCFIGETVDSEEDRAVIACEPHIVASDAPQPLLDV